MKDQTLYIIVFVVIIFLAIVYYILWTKSAPLNDAYLSDVKIDCRSFDLDSIDEYHYNMLPVSRKNNYYASNNVIHANYNAAGQKYKTSVNKLRCFNLKDDVRKIAERLPGQIQRAAIVAENPALIVM